MQIRDRLIQGGGAGEGWEDLEGAVDKVCECYLAAAASSEGDAGGGSCAGNGKEGGGGKEGGVRDACSSALPWASSLLLDDLAALYTSGRSQVLLMIHSSASSYLSYLALSGTHEATPGDTDVTATLRLLRLLARHGAYLDDLFAERLLETPTRPWRAIALQVTQAISPIWPLILTENPKKLDGCQIGMLRATTRGTDFFHSWMPNLYKCSLLFHSWMLTLYECSPALCTARAWRSLCSQARRLDSLPCWRRES
jgi:hypothetical protein